MCLYYARPHLLIAVCIGPTVTFVLVGDYASKCVGGSENIRKRLSSPPSPQKEEVEIQFAESPFDLAATLPVTWEDSAHIIPAGYGTYLHSLPFYLDTLPRPAMWAAHTSLPSNPA